jgi:hypothetical protein
VPTEVLVMCTRCGRPQVARAGNCVVCGTPLPDAPRPVNPAPEQPFFQLEWRGGRTLIGVDRRLTYRAAASTPPTAVELINLQGVALGRRLLWEILVLLPLAAVLPVLAPALWPVAVALAGMGLLLLALVRQYVLVLKTQDGGFIRWPLAVTRLGSEQAQRVDEAWSAVSRALAERGVSVHDDPGALGPPP